MIGIRYIPQIKMLRATNNCGLNFYGKNDFGNSENWEYSSVPNGGCFEATVRWADQLTVKDFTSF